MRSIGEIFWHISQGRVEWFRRLNAPGADALARAMSGNPAQTATELREWLAKTWAMVEATLRQWTVDDLAWMFEHQYQGKVYAVSRQWVIWRIMAHDIQHGGQISELLGQQGVFPTELTWLGGHLTEPKVLRDS